MDSIAEAKLMATSETGDRPRLILTEPKDKEFQAAEITSVLPGRNGPSDNHNMHRTRVASSSIASIGYDPALEILEIEFCDGALYQYSGVTRDEHLALMAAESKGAHFNLQIREKHPCRRLKLGSFAP